jgi:hypothetical protein
MVATTLKRSGGRLVLRGVVNPPRARKQPRIAIDRFLSCQRRQTVKVPKVKPDRLGRFAVRIKVPSGPRAVLYRARTKVPPRGSRRRAPTRFPAPLTWGRWTPLSLALSPFPASASARC